MAIFHVLFIYLIKTWCHEKILQNCTDNHWCIIVIADHRKIGLVSDYVTANVNRITTLVTDWFPDIDYIKDFEDLGINVIQTKPRSL